MTKNLIEAVNLEWVNDDNSMDVKGDKYEAGRI